MLFLHILVLIFTLLDTVLAELGQQHHLAVGKSRAHQTSKQVITPQLKEFIDGVRKNWNITGLSIAVVHTNGDAELEGFGNSTEEGTEVNTHTLFNIASCSKAFLTASLGILMDDFAHNRNVTPLPQTLKSFDWYTRIIDLFPNDWALADGWSHEKATIRDVLTHVSGLSGHDLSYTSSDSPVDVIRRMRHLRPSFGLREKFQYNNQMYVLATHIVSSYSRMPYIEFVSKRIFTSLNMTSTTFSELEAFGTGLLSHAFNAEGRRIPFWFPDSVKHLTSGPGGIISNAHDMAKWTRMLLHKGVDYSSNKTIMPLSVFKAMTSAYSLVSPAPYPEFSFIAYDLGWNRFSFKGHKILQHHGAIPGFSTQAAFLPHDGIGVVILCNASQKEKQIEAILYRIVESLLGLPDLASSRLATLQVDQLRRSSERIYDDQVNLQLSESPLHGIDGTDSFSVEKYIGTYTNPGYPNITICHPAQLVSESSINNICSDTLKDFSFFGDFNEISTILYLAIPSLWVHQARLCPIGSRSHRFKVTSTYLFPQGYGRDTSPFEMSEMAGMMGDIEFVVGEDGKVIGFGMQSSDVRERTERQRRGGGVEDTADAWFDRA